MQENYLSGWIKINFVPNSREIAISTVAQIVTNYLIAEHLKYHLVNAIQNITKNVKEEIFEKLDLLLDVKDVEINANSYYETKSIDISKYKFKTISVKCDYNMKFIVLVSDDGNEFDEYYSTTTEANRLVSISFEEDYYYLKLRIENTNSNPHKIIYMRVKGRRIWG